MSGYKVMIVDDSPFSRTLIGETLREAGCEIVGEADSIDCLLETYIKCKPDVVTMDLVLPGADGFECSRALRLHDPHVKIILISSMKDEETETEARRIGIVGYVQKPVDGDKLNKIINHVMFPDSLYVQLQNEGLDIFQESLAQSLTRMTKTPISFTPTEISEHQFTSQGITAVIGIIGRHTGSMIMDLSIETAEQCVSALLNRPSNNKDEVLAMVAELANIVAGVACSMLNKQDKTFGLRVSPPSIFSGNSAEIATPNLNITGSHAETGFGRIFIGIGFKKGLVLWM
jgi:DNA-binding NarL/FixJ family response regulator